MAKTYRRSGLKCPYCQAKPVRGVFTPPSLRKQQGGKFVYAAHQAGVAPYFVLDATPVPCAKADRPIPYTSWPAWAQEINERELNEQQAAQDAKRRKRGRG